MQFNKDLKVHDYLMFLKNAPGVVLSTVDNAGHADSRVVSVMGVIEEKIYFMTFDKKELYFQLKQHPFVSVTGLQSDGSNLNSRFVSVKGEIKETDHQYLDKFLDEIPYLKVLYPPEKRDHLKIFVINSGTLSAYDLSIKPPFSIQFDFGNNK